MEKLRQILRSWGLPVDRPGDPGRSLATKKRLAYIDGFLCVLTWGFTVMEPIPLNVFFTAAMTAIFACDVGSVRHHARDDAGEHPDDEAQDEEDPR